MRRIKTAINRLLRLFRNAKMRKKLKCHELTVISSNCNGCLILHDLGMRYNSPFVNLYIEAEEYLRLLQNLPWYMEQELIFVPSEKPYPVAKLGDVHLHCVHYPSEQEVREKWNQRKARMDWDNLYVMFTDRDGCTLDHLKTFDALPFAHKVVFTHKAYENIRSAVYVPGFETAECVGELHRFTGWSGRRHYDCFDYVAWFNTEEES